MWGQRQFLGSWQLVSGPCSYSTLLTVCPRAALGSSLKARLPYGTGSFLELVSPHLFQSIRPWALLFPILRREDHGGLFPGAQGNSRGP